MSGQAIVGLAPLKQRLSCLLPTHAFIAGTRPEKIRIQKWYTGEAGRQAGWQAGWLVRASKPVADLVGLHALVCGFPFIAASLTHPTHPQCTRTISH